MIGKKNNPCLGLLEGMVVVEVMVVVVEMMRMTKILKQLLRLKMGKTQMYQVEAVVEVMNHHPTQRLEIWDLEVEGDIEVKEDEEGEWVHRVYQVHRDHKDLRVLRV